MSGAKTQAVMTQASQLTPELVRHSREVTQELQDVLRSTVKSDTVVVIPSLPSAPLPLDADDTAVQKFLKRCQLFGCIPALAGCPHVTVPAGDAMVLAWLQYNGVPHLYLTIQYNTIQYNTIVIKEHLLQTK